MCSAQIKNKCKSVVITANFNKQVKKYLLIGNLLLITLELR